MRNLVVGTSLGLLSFMAVWPGQGKEIAMIAPIISPHFDDRGRERIGDVISAVMKHCGHSVTFNMVPFGRYWADYKEQEFDALATAEAAQAFPGYTTKPFIHLQDGAMVVEGSGLEFTIGVKKFARKRIISFPGTQETLGIEHLIPAFASFRNQAKRSDQVRPLLAGRADAISTSVSSRRISPSLCASAAKPGKSRTWTPPLRPDFAASSPRGHSAYIFATRRSPMISTAITGN